MIVVMIKQQKNLFVEGSNMPENVHVEKSADLLVKLIKKTVILSQAHTGAENATKISCTRITIMIYGFHDNHCKFLHTC